MSINMDTSPYQNDFDTDTSSPLADAIWGAPDSGEYEECTLCGGTLSGDETTMGICDSCAGL